MLQSQHIGEKLQLNTPDVFNKDNVTVLLVSTATIQKTVGIEPIL